MAVPDFDAFLLQGLPAPPCEGPKLGPFKKFSGQIEFLGRLSLDSGPETHSHVFEVRIGEERYALKMFKFYYAEEARFEYLSDMHRKVSDEIMTYHSDPFYAECRAYGRINEYYEGLGNRARRQPQGNRPESQNSEIKPIAVPCYGYITVPAEYEDVINDKFRAGNWVRTYDEEEGRVPRRPIRALVKKLIPSDVSILNPRRMLTNLKRLRALGIFPRDIYARNFKDGLLVDFSIAWTEPHWFMQNWGTHQLHCSKMRELCLFDYIMKEEGIKTTVRATPNIDYLQKLRSRDVSDNEEENSSNASGSST